MPEASPRQLLRRWSRSIVDWSFDAAFDPETRMNLPVRLRRGDSFKKIFQEILGAFFQIFSQGLLHQVPGGLLERGFVQAGF